MKRCSMIVMLVVLLGAVFGPVKVADAAELYGTTEITNDNWGGARTVVVPGSEKLDNIVGKVIMERTEVCLPDQQRDASHTERVLSARHELTVNGELVAWVDVDCTVWDYPDGKVHLYSRTMSLTVTPGYEDSYLTYGSIFNTDGSYSGTTGDRVCLSDGVNSAHFGLYFYVTTQTHRFSNSRVSP